MLTRQRTISLTQSIETELQKQIKQTNAATTIVDRMLAFIQLYTTIHKNAQIIKREMKRVCEVILHKSDIIIAEIEHFIEVEPDLHKDEIVIMQSTITVVKDTVSILH